MVLERCVTHASTPNLISEKMLTNSNIDIFSLVNMVNKNRHSYKNRREPSLAKADEQAAFAFATEVLRNNAVSDTTLVQVRELFGDRGAVGMGAIIAHYHSGAIALGLADIPLPDGTRTCLPM